MEVTIKGKPVMLSVPPSHSARQMALLAVATNAWIGFGALVGICWPPRPALKATLSGAKFDGLVYGASVRDELHAMGVTDDQIAEAAKGLLPQIIDSYPKEESVSAHADFIDPPPEGSTL